MLHSRYGRVVQYAQSSIETPGGTALDRCQGGVRGGPAGAQADLTEDRGHADEGIPVWVHQSGFGFVHLEPRLATLVPAIVKFWLAEVNWGHDDVEFGLLEDLQ